VLDFLLFIIILFIFTLVYNVIIKSDMKRGLVSGLREGAVLLLAAVAIAWFVVLFIT